MVALGLPVLVHRPTGLHLLELLHLCAQGEDEGTDGLHRAGSSARTAEVVVFDVIVVAVVVVIVVEDGGGGLVVLDGRRGFVPAREDVVDLGAGVGFSCPGGRRTLGLNRSRTVLWES